MSRASETPGSVEALQELWADMFMKEATVFT